MNKDDKDKIVKDIDFQEEIEVLTLTGIDGNDIEFELIAELEYNEKWYVYLVPVEKIEGLEDDELLIAEVHVDEEGFDTFEFVEEEELLEKLFNEFLELQKQYESDESDKK